MYLIPSVKSCTVSDKHYALHEHSAIRLDHNDASSLLAADQLAQELSAQAALNIRVVRRLNDSSADIILGIDSALKDSYSIRIDKTGVHLSGLWNVRSCLAGHDIWDVHRHQGPHSGPF